MAKHWLRIDLPAAEPSGRLRLDCCSPRSCAPASLPGGQIMSSSERQLSDSQKARLVRTLRPVAPALANVQLWSDDHPENVRYRQGA